MDTPPFTPSVEPAPQPAPAPVLPVMPTSPPAKSNWPTVALIAVILILGYAILAWSMNLWPFSAEGAISPTPTPSTNLCQDAPSCLIYNPGLATWENRCGDVVEVPQGGWCVPVAGTADWKTYTNTQYGFEVRYPATVVVRTDMSTTYNVRFITNNTEFMAISIETQAQYQDEVASGHDIASSVLGQNNNYVALAGFPQDCPTCSSYEAIKSQIISTFRFTQ